MLRIFFPLYTILAIFFICFAIAVNFLPEILLSKRISDFSERLTRGTFYLIEKELDGMDFTQQQVALKKIQVHFKFPIYLLNPGDPRIDQSTWKSIMAGKVVNPEIDKTDDFFKKMQHSNTTIAITFSDSRSELDHKEAYGTYYLIKKILFSHSQEQWGNIINELQSHFGFPIRLELLADIAFDEDVKKLQLLDGKIISLGHDTDQWRFISQIAKTEYVVILGPIEKPINEILLIFIIFFALIFLLAIALFLWFRPLWHSINELSLTADTFGSGKLNARANVKQSAVLGKLASQFNSMADHISDLISGHRELTNAVSHELRTPIARMRFGLDMLEKADNTDKQRFMAGLNTDVDDLENLVNELLHYARFERSSPIENKQIIAVKPWLESIIENARGYADGINITFTSRKNLDEKYVQFCPSQMARVIHNLLRNACHYGKQQITVALEINNNISIHVDDDGEGIAEKDRQKVFDAFIRLDKSRDRQSGGHGLGLAIAKKIILAHNGNISVSDSPMGGARFSIYWPCKDKNQSNQ